MPLPELTDFLQPRRQVCEIAGSTQSLDCAQLLMCGAARSHEIRMVSIREPVGPRPRRGHHSALLEQDDRAPGTRERKHTGDRLHPLGVGNRVPPALGNTELHALGRGDAGDELRPFWLGASQLEMRRAWPAQRATAEESATQVRTAAASARHDASRRIRERRYARTENAGLMQDLQRALVSVDMQLVPRRPVECPSPVRTDLRRNPERAEEAERATRHRRVGNVEVDRYFAAPLQVDAAGAVEQAGQLREPVALGPRSDRGELVPEIVRE